MGRRVAWDVSHGEFTIQDGYYFSRLLKALRERDAEILINERLDDAADADVLVLNYPEKEFSEADGRFIEEFMGRGGRVLALAYYDDEDRVASILNELVKPYGVEFLPDAVVDETNCLDGDPFMVVSSRVYGFNRGVRRVLMPYAAPLELLAPAAEVVVEGGPTAKTRSGGRAVLGCRVQVGEGELVCLGTCVFWDNYSIGREDNLAFSLNLLGVSGGSPASVPDEEGG